MDIFYDIAAAPPVPAQDSYNHVVDVRPLLFLARMIHQLLRINFTRPTHFQRDNVGDDLWAYRGRLDRALSKAALHNFKTRLKWSMLGDKAWRVQVIDGLGGAAGLARWGRLQAAFLARKQAHAGRDIPASPAPDYASQFTALLTEGATLAPPLKPVPTDASGWFRLAPIGRVMRPRAELSDPDMLLRRQVRKRRAGLRREIWDAMPFEEKIGRPYVCRRETLHDVGPVEDWVFEIKPIPVTAQELSGNNKALILRSPQGVSKDEVLGKELGAHIERSFETPAKQAPQDEDLFLRPQKVPP